MNSLSGSTLGIFVVLCVAIRGGQAASRIYYPNANKNGFTSATNANKKVDITYECPNGIDDVAIYINQFSAPSNIESLRISNCKTFTIFTKCSNERKTIQKLQVTNIKHLIIQRWQYSSMVPPTVVFENISRIDLLPTESFGQINRAMYNPACYVQPVDLQSIYFRNVTIDTVQSGAFVGLNNFKNFSFINVKIKRIQTGGVQLKHDFSGTFEMRNCLVEVIEHLGIQTSGVRTILADNNFTEISSSGINGTVRDFYFTSNFVETLQPHAFSLLATNVFILDNDFLHLKSSALEKLSPGLIQDSGRNFGKLKFIYDFSKNSLNFLDAGSLHPDYLSYENVQTEMMFSRNKFLCSCENLGWMFSGLGFGPNTAQLESFYDMVLDDAYGNVCEKPYGETCNLSLSSVRKMIECGTCSKKVTLDDLCDKNHGGVTTVKTVKFLTSFNVTEEIFPEDQIMNLMNYTARSRGASGGGLGQFYVLIVLVNVYVYFGQWRLVR